MLEIKNLSAVVGGQCRCECEVPEGWKVSKEGFYGSKWLFVERAANDNHCQVICENYARRHQYPLMKYRCFF